MRRADRLFQIVQLLRGGRLTTAKSLAERLEVSPRTIYRDVADLIGSGVPIDGEAGVGYLMRSGFDVPPLMFTRAEVAAVVAGARMIRSFGGAEMALAAQEALLKIEAVLPQGLRDSSANVAIYAQDAGAMPERDRQMIDTLDRAIESRLRTTLDYADAEGKVTRREVRPLGLWFWGKVWTLISWCELRKDFRTFRIDRIMAASTGQAFRTERDKSLSNFFTQQLFHDPR
ncbi:helix-turn-helix transcriptional regulator [Phaeovulum sp.]|uniref:helix-turn-helix transcriptional regulator n=1 Tax=Phaeovulum sp. TaxID=2934796 RepID=UPI0027301764|nr:YafY family protein [Phaeovulum sp.]MDP1667508.1 YafY family protein [Phaeovulum sp.]MDZ4120025.1 YafY family protein [Phaeovulum sp.]